MKDIDIGSSIRELFQSKDSLENSQSLLQGNITELQAGLQEAKDLELQLAKAQEELSKNSQLTKEELELQKQALEQLSQANTLFQQELRQRQTDNERAIKILQDDSLEQNSKIR